MTDNDLVVETTARIGEHTAIVRVLDTGTVKLTPRMAAQLDRIDPRDLEALGRIEIQSGGRPETVLIGKNRNGDLAIAGFPRLPRIPRIDPPTGSDPLWIRLEAPNDPFAGHRRRIVHFEGRAVSISDSQVNKCRLGPSEPDFDYGGYEELFREQIAEYDRTAALREELLGLPRILLRED
ncbi:hypothetical protein ACT17_22790 [Mycolicibacterium conceptionense]|uniref:Uncharacterized protein n=1 Tax=Mycolicibacterium conceptionense TaxID=451644 RepID=A0A0J8U4B2_9MYCO|nr:hypothetical protein [Mycolicibacterium conceptionense]KMV15927.1 hypothetical protein ACT17_22790 [Mycolicibacterium conceptionense]